MSYKNYSEEAVKKIMTKVKDSKTKDHRKDGDSTNESTLNKPAEVDSGGTVDTNESQRSTYEHDHPIAIKSDEISSTHAFVEKSFESNLTEDSIWDEILDTLGVFFWEESSGITKLHPSKKMWTHIDHANHETVISLTKKGGLAKLRISQRVGFFSSPIQGVLHGAYTSLILFGFIFAIFSPSFLFSIGILASLWSLIGMIIFKLNKVSRSKKLVSLKNLADQLADRFSISGNTERQVTNEK